MSCTALKSIVAVTLLTVCLGPGAWRAAADESAEARAKSVLSQVGVSRGLCMVLGDTDGALTLALAHQSELTLFVQTSSAAEAEAIRRAADAQGLLGGRLWVQPGKLSRLRLADDLADAVVVEPAAANVPPEELRRVLRPLGKALVGGAVQTKPYPKGFDDWTHPYHAPDNNPQSNDLLARRPFLTHFMAPPWYCPLPQMTVISGGRIFKVFGDRSSARPQEPLVNTLLAMSAFNGTILWRRDLTPGFMIHRNTFIATPDAVMLADDKSCKIIDAATGKVRDEIVAPKDLSDGPVWKWMGLEDGVLYALVGEEEGKEQPLRGNRIRGAGWPWWAINNYTFGFGRTLLAIDPATKKILWSYRDQEPIDSRGMCMKNGRLYFYSEGKFLACMDTRKGSLLWKSTDKAMLDAIGDTGKAQHWMLGFASTAYVKCTDEALYFAGPQRPRIAAVSAENGKLLWQRDGGNSQLLLRPEGVYALGEGRTNSVPSSFKLASLTGQVLATFPSRDRCTRATGCVDSIFTRGGSGGSTALFDVKADKPSMGLLSPMRPACQDGVVVAHGYLFWGPWQCRCDMTQLGVISLGSGGSFNYTQNANEADHLQRAAGDDQVAPLKLAPDDWPTYRKDNGRHVLSQQVIGEQAARRWTFDAPGRALPTAPIAAGGLVLTGGADGAVRALDAATGQPRWTAYTGGPIKYPPAIWNGRVYVGSGDGCIYCLEAATGRQLWRFDAAPVPRMIPLYGTIASTWPIGSGVLVDRGVVYAAAGISNFDGTHVYALDALTGGIRWQNHARNYGDSDVPEGGVSVQGHLLLHGNAIYMASGNRPPIASYALADGKFAPAGGGRGKDLYIRNNQVRGAGFPLYWRPEDDQFISPMELETPAGVLVATTNQLALFDPSAKPADKPKPKWANNAYAEIAAVAITKNAVLVTGLNRAPGNANQTQAGVAAVSLADGKTLWRQPLPSSPVLWGMAVDGTGRIVVSMTDGRVAMLQSP